MHLPPSRKMAGLTTRWCVSLVSALDWRRLGELVAGICKAVGMDLIAYRSDLRGRVWITLNRCEQARARPCLILVTGWDREGSFAALPDLEQLHDEAAAAGLAQPIYVTTLQPEIVPEVLTFAQGRGIEVYDATTLVDFLEMLPSATYRELFTRCTRQGYDTPTCPICLSPMQLASIGTLSPGPEPGSSPRSDVLRTEETIRLSSDAIVGEEIICRRLLVAAGSEIHFLKPVSAFDIRIDGTVSGHLRAFHKIYLGASAHFSGTITAREMKLDPGAVIKGSTAVRRDLLLILPPPIPGETAAWRCRRAMEAPQSCGRMFFQIKETGA